MAQGVFWVGKNGNVYTRVAGQDGVKDYGDYNSLRTISSKDPNAGFNYVTSGLDQIDDPAGGGGGGAPAPVGSGGGGAAPKVFNEAGFNNTKRTYDELPGLLEAALEAEERRYGNTVRDFGVQEQGQRKQYDESTTTNQLNYDSNFMDSIRAGVKGVGGLLSLLRGTGAAGGTAEDVARDTVGETTSKDIRTGADTRDENQSGLDNSLSTFLTELGRKREVNEDAFENNKRAVQRDTFTQMQELLGKMAGFYSDVDDTENANRYMNRAGDLTSKIARNSRAQVSQYDTAPVTVAAPELTAFADPTQPSIMTAPDGQVGSGIFTMNERRRKEPQAAPVGV